MYLLPLFLSAAVFGRGIVADFNVPIYPSPLDLSSDDSTVPPAWKGLVEKFDAYYLSEQKDPASSLYGTENLTFGLKLFSRYDPAISEFSYHYTAPEIQNAPNGTTEVDGDSIYRMASVSKLFNVYSGMLELSLEEWHRPLSKIFPKLVELTEASPHPKDRVLTPQWDKITPWALANHLAGAPGPIFPGLGDIMAQFTTADQPLQFGLPVIDVNELGPCFTSQEVICTAEEFLATAATQPPIFLPWSSPSYSDGGMSLLGMAISEMTGRSIGERYSEGIFKPLGMEGSFTSPPEPDVALARGVMPEGVDAFLIDLSIAIASGGLMSTVNDLTKFGLNILNNTLLPADVTRKWMKPTTLTPSFSYSIGGPWEIMRYVQPSNGRITDLFVKLGDAGSTGGGLILIPEYDVGVSFLNAGINASSRSTSALIVLDHVAEALLPALEAQAETEAQRNFVGTYVSSDQALNSSVTVGFNESTVPGANYGLTITSWISNGTDMLDNLLFFAGVTPKLLPTIIDRNIGNGPGKVAFSATDSVQLTNYALGGEGVGPFLGFVSTNVDWANADRMRYGGVPSTAFVFDVDGEGRATAVSPLALRTTLKREEAEA